MIDVARSMLLHRWPLYLGALATTSLGAALVHSGVVISLEHGQGSGPAEDIGALMGIIITLALFLSVSVVGATFAFTVSERLRDLALLRLLGTGPGALRRMVHCEALAVGAAGGALGYLLGIPATAAQLVLLADAGISLPHPPHPLWMIGADMVFGTLLGSLGSWGARRRAAKVAVLTAVVGEDGPRRAMTASRWVIGVLAAAATGASAAMSVVGLDLTVSLGTSMLTLICAATAMAQLAPVLLAPIYTATRALLGRFPLLGLAGADGRFALRRSASIVVPVIVLTGMVGGFQSLIDTVPQMLRVANLQAYDAEFVVTGTELEHAELNGIDGVQTVSVQQSLPTQAVLQVRPGHEQEVSGSTLTAPVIAVDPEDYRATHSEPYAFGSVEALGPDAAVIGSALSVYAGPDSIERIEMDGPAGTVSLNVAGKAGTSLSVVDPVVVDAGGVPPVLLESTQDQALVRVEAGADPQQVRTELEKAAGTEQVQTVEQMVQADVDANNRSNNLVMRAIVGIGALFALVNVITATAVGHSQRTAQVGRLRTSGMSRAAVIGSVVLETLLGVVAGWLLGCAATVLTVLPTSITGSRELGQWLLSIPLGMLGALGAVCAIGACLAAAATTWRLTRRPLVDAVSAG